MLDVKRALGRRARLRQRARALAHRDASPSSASPARRAPGRVGIWVRRPEQGRRGAEDKIAAIGLRLKRWVSLHGISLNVRPDLEHYAGIVPCGIADHGVTSLAELGRPATMEVVDNVLRATFEALLRPDAHGRRPARSASGIGRARDLTRAGERSARPARADRAPKP